MSNRQDGETDPHVVANDSDPIEDASSGGAAGEDLPAPSEGLSVERAIKTQLRALRDNDHPYTNAGIKTAFNFAAPAYRNAVGGSLDAFVQHFTGPIYRALIDHREAERGRLRVDGGVAREKVVVTDGSGDESTYEFTLEKQSGGKYAGCWMTTDVELVYVGESPDHQHMPNVEFDGVEIKCKEGDVLRDVLLRASGVSPYNQAAQYANCNGKGLCGTCAVEVVEGDVTEKTAQERRRLRLPPHGDNDDENFRLSCQTRVLSDLKVHKHEGMWGQHIEEYSRDTDEQPGDPIRVSDEEYLGTDESVAAAESTRSSDREQLDLSAEAQALLDETESMLDDDRDRPIPTGEADGTDGDDEEPEPDGDGDDYDLPG